MCPKMNQMQAKVSFLGQKLKRNSKDLTAASDVLAFEVDFLGDFKTNFGEVAWLAFGPGGFRPHFATDSSQAKASRTLSQIANGAKLNRLDWGDRQSVAMLKNHQFGERHYRAQFFKGNHARELGFKDKLHRGPTRLFFG